MRAVYFLVHVVVVAVALYVCTLLTFVGVSVTASSTEARIGTLLGVALIFGLVNALIKPIIKTVGCAFYILTLGLISLVVNALLFLLVEYLSDQVGLGFELDGFWSALLGAIVVGVVSWFLHLIIPDRIDAR